VHDYVGLVVCDTRRARSWRIAFAKANIDAKVDETRGDDSEHGAYKVSVLRRDLPAASAMVTAVTRGELALPGAGITKTAVIAVVVIAALAAALMRGWW
jgi:hypothetical protein